MKNIHILPTDKPSRLYLTKEEFYFLLPNIKGNDVKFQNIYITSDEEIKEGDWCYGLFNGGVVIRSEFDIPKNSQYYKEYGLKIILTTDQDLIKDGVQAIDDEFLEWFVKNPSCEKVEVEKTQYNPVFDEDDLSYDGMTTYYSYKIIIQKEEPKQETLEEVAERIYPTDCTNWSIKVPLNERKAFVEGAKWQQERSYSEEEVEDFIYKVCGTVARLQGITLNGNHIDTAYKQFKKK